MKRILNFQRKTMKKASRNRQVLRIFFGFLTFPFGKRNAILANLSLKNFFISKLNHDNLIINLPPIFQKPSNQINDILINKGTK